MVLQRASVEAGRERLRAIAQEQKYFGPDWGQCPAALLPVSPSGEQPLSSPHFSRTEQQETDVCLYHRPPGIASSCPEPEALRTWVVSRKKSTLGVSGTVSAWEVT